MELYQNEMGEEEGRSGEEGERKEQREGRGRREERNKRKKPEFSRHIRTSVKPEVCFKAKSPLSALTDI